MALAPAAIRRLIASGHLGQRTSHGSPLPRPACMPRCTRLLTTFTLLPLACESGNAHYTHQEDRCLWMRPSNSLAPRQSPLALRGARLRERHSSWSVPTSKRGNGVCAGTVRGTCSRPDCVEHTGTALRDGAGRYRQLRHAVRATDQTHADAIAGRAEAWRSVPVGARAR